MIKKLLLIKSVVKLRSPIAIKSYDNVITIGYKLLNVPDARLRWKFFILATLQNVLSHCCERFSSPRPIKFINGI